MLIVGVDLDGVLGNYVDAIIDKSEDITAQRGDVPKTYSMIEPGFFCDRKHFLENHIKVVEDVHSVEPLGSKDVLLGTPHTIIAVTARGDDNSPHCERFREDTKEWLRKNYDGVKDVIFTHQKEYTGCDVIIEDNGENIQRCAEKGMTTILIRYDYNKDYEVFADYVVDNITEAMSIVNSL